MLFVWHSVCHHHQISLLTKLSCTTQFILGESIRYQLNIKITRGQNVADGHIQSIRVIA